MLRTYARVVGATLTLLSVMGIAGILGDVVGLVEGILYLGTGGIFLYTGLGRIDIRDVRDVIGGMGVLYLLASMLTLSISTVYHLPPLGNYDLTDDYVRTAFGILSILAARFLPCEDEPPPTL